mgnify:CR=1 FL=1
MTSVYEKKISQDLNLTEASVGSVIKLLDEGCTIPFIARYRKEATGSLDEVAIAAIRDMVLKLQELDKRRVSIIQSLKERELLTSELEEKLNACETLSELEDIYLPFKPKRKTRAMKAREMGLEPLATAILKYETEDPDSLAEKFIDAEKEVPSKEAAIDGALDIIAEWMNEDETVRKKMRALWKKKSRIESTVIKGKETEGEKFKDYFEGRAREFCA